jgi:NAD(P)H-hydrate epimerase
MKIISAQQTQEVDKYSIQNEPITSLNLMERAARACVESICRQSTPFTEFFIFCGKGNNGGDGLAIARMLATMHRKVQVFVINYTEKESADFTANLKRLQKQNLVTIHFINDLTQIKSLIDGIQLNKNHIVIDSLLGTGINKKVEGLLADVIEHINQLHQFVISIDVPSGLFCDEKPNHKSIIRANRTLTFQRPKLTFLFVDFYDYAGNFEVLDIGLD